MNASFDLQSDPQNGSNDHFWIYDKTSKSYLSRVANTFQKKPLFAFSIYISICVSSFIYIVKASFYYTRNAVN